MKRMICTGALLGALLLTLGVPARAVDPLYAGELDVRTGEALTDSAPVEAERVWLSAGMYYDRATSSFVYPVAGGVHEVSASVADGMIVSTPVSITAPDGVELSVTRSGSESEDVDLSSITRPGFYTVSVMDVDAAATLFRFTVVGESTNLSGGYTMPDGFYILEATLDGGNVPYDRNYIGMEAEGLYEIEYVCPDTAVHYHLTTTVDRTPPQITLDGELDKRGRFHSAVQIGGIERGMTAVLTRDGVETDFPYDGRLTQAGMYQLQVFDAAGNAATSQFTILVYINLSGLLFFVLVCLVLAAVLGYILFKRKRFRKA